MIAVAQFEELQQIVQIDRRPERRHHVLRQHAAGLLTADALFQQFVVQVQRAFVMLFDQRLAGRLIQMLRRTRRLAIALRLLAQFRRRVEFDIDIRVAARNFIVAPCAVTVPL